MNRDSRARRIRVIHGVYSIKAVCKFVALVVRSRDPVDTLVILFELEIPLRYDRVKDVELLGVTGTVRRQVR